MSAQRTLVPNLWTDGGTTINGDGSQENPLRVTGGSIAVNTDGATIGGDGRSTSPLRVNLLGITNAEIANATIALGKLADMATGFILGRSSPGAGPVELLTPPVVATMLNTLRSDVFGTGLDGPLAIAPGATLVITRDMFYTDGDIPATATLDENGFHAHFSGLLTLNGVIERIVNNGGNGGVSAAGAAGAAKAVGTLAGSIAGGAGALFAAGAAGGGSGTAPFSASNAGGASVAGTNGAGANGNFGGASSGAPGMRGGGAGAGGGGGGANVGGNGAASGGMTFSSPNDGYVVGADFRAASVGRWLTAPGTLFSYGSGGGGGGGAYNGASIGGGGGGGGAGGAHTYVAARFITGTGVIRARGGNGGNGGTGVAANAAGGGGGGGGAGGLAVLTYQQLPSGGVLPSVQSPGGTGGAAGGAGAGPGFPGGVGGLGGSGTAVIFPV
jgi:hypothetical protein